VQETYWIFGGGEAAGLGRFVENPERFARFLDPENLIGSLMLEAARFCCDRGQGAFWKVQSLFTEALFLLSDSRRTESSDYQVSSSRPRQSFGLQVEQYLRTHLSEPVALAAIARHMRVSPSTLSHSFRSETGVPPMARLMELRIEHAKSLLLKGEKLKVIAGLTGHSSEYHLSRNFKAVTGISPSGFRSAQSGGSAGPRLRPSPAAGDSPKHFRLRGLP
jgi:AraC-like DNA-binding protein